MFISVSSQTSLINEDNFFVFALYDSTASTILLEKQAPAKPYGNPLQISFLYNCLNGHIYIIKLWESPDDTATGAVRNSFSQSINSNQASVLIKMDEYLQADVTSGLVNGATSYVNLNWVNWEYSLERIGQGTMVPDFTDNTEPNYHQDAAGGFHLIQSGDVFQPEEKFVARFVPQVIPNLGGDPSPIFGSGRIITADETLTNADTGQALLIQSATNKITITLPALSTVSDFVFMYFYSAGGSHINAVMQAPGSDKIIYPGDLSKIILGQCELLKIYKAFGKWNVENELSGVKSVGRLFYDYIPEINSLPLNGQLVSRATYPRLWAWAQTLSAGSVVSEAAWNSTFITVDGLNYYTNQGYFSTGDGSTTFRLPLIYYFLRPVDTTIRNAGSFQVQTIQLHDHGITASNQSNFGGAGYVPGVNLAGTESGGRTDETGSMETKPSNIGLPLYIRT